jgi:hypothetical protein
MGDTATAGEASLAVEEARLARAATAGDGSAFAALYERYKQRAFNLAYRIAGSKPKPAPTPTQPVQSASAPAAAVEEPPVEEPSRGHNPPGKPPDRPPSSRGS